MRENLLAEWAVNVANRIAKDRAKHQSCYAKLF